MEDLALVGEEPAWERREIHERLEQRDLALLDPDAGDEANARKLRRQIDRLAKDRADLFSEL